VENVVRPRPAGHGTGQVDLGALVVAAAAAALSYGVAITLLIALPRPGALTGVTQYLVSGLAPLVAVGVVHAVRVRDLRAFGVRGVSWRWALVAVGGGVAAVLLSIAVTVVVVVLTGPPGDLQADYQAAARSGPALLVLTLLTGAVLTPVGEELLFRGVVANALLRVLSPWVAVPLSAAVFAVAHGISYITPVAFVVGVIAALLFRATGSIWPGVVVHAVNNSYSTLAAAFLAPA
jgi:uncharacterized protein